MSLAAQIAELRRELGDLHAEVARQAARIVQLEAEVGVAGEEFELVLPEPAAEARSTAASSAGTAPSPAAARGAEVAPPAPAGAVSEEERRVVAQEVGRFLRAQLDGRLSGPSGRDKVALPNRVYIVCRDIEGRLYDPPLILDRFYEVRNLCKRGASFGNSIFVGLPSRWEARAAVEAASLRWGC
jgi:hypothetical protein